MIYVGIDLHRKWSQLAALDAAGETENQAESHVRPQARRRASERSMPNGAGEDRDLAGVGRRAKCEVQR